VRRGTDRRSWRLAEDEDLYPSDDRAFRREIWSFLETNLADDIKEGPHQGGEIGPEWVGGALEFMRRCVKAGLVTYSWPTEYGGTTGPRRRQAIINEAFGYFRSPLPWHTGIDIVAPALMIYGSADQQQQWLPRIGNGDVIINNGLTEPEAGSDLSAVAMRAVRHADGYRITGHKTFQSRAHYATHSFVLARTDPESARRDGLSLFLVDLHAPGVTISPQWNIVGGRQNDVYFDDVCVDADCLLGRENDGWNNLRLSLGFERSGIHEYGRLLGLCDELNDYLDAYGSACDRYETVRLQTDMALWLAEWRELCHRVVDRHELVKDIGIDASIATLKQKVAAPALSGAACRLIGSSVFLASGRPADSASRTRANFASLYYESRSYHARGTPEIQKNTIATKGLGMPRSSAGRTATA
jgi:3-oxocholest-4-en-26-oyl-CoA dehydrogenase alpha subunit